MGSVVSPVPKSGGAGTPSTSLETVTGTGATRQLMNDYNIYELCSSIALLETCRSRLEFADSAGMAFCNDDLIAMIERVLGQLKSVCERLEADSTLVGEITVLQKACESGSVDRREAVLSSRLGTILNLVHHNLAKRRFMILSEEEASYYANPNLFGKIVQEKYSHYALRDAVAAGSCFAASQYTASVFHCMRLAEHGLRKLASNRLLNIKLHNKKGPIPIEFATWNDVITAIHNKISKIRQRPVGPMREADLQFFSSCADQCDYMKELWRNPLSHTRRFCKREDALAVIARVKDFVIVVGEHKSSIPADDTFSTILAQAAEEGKEAYLASLSKPTTT